MSVHLRWLLVADESVVCTEWYFWDDGCHTRDSAKEPEALVGSTSWPPRWDAFYALYRTYHSIVVKKHHRCESEKHKKTCFYAIAMYKSNKTNTFVGHRQKWLCYFIRYQMKQEVKVIWQKAPHRGYIPRLGVTPGGRNLYHWIPGVGVPISVP